MPINWYMYFVAALIPMVIGSVYYHPKLTGNAWMKVNGFTEESLKEGNMPVILGVSFLLSILLAFMIGNFSVHQSALIGLLAPEIFETGSQAQQDFNQFMNSYGDRHRSFTHGIAHGMTAAVFIALPLIGINALFERRGGKYVWIHFGYWLITLALMGGLLCATLKYGPMN
ncbi:MAG: DUF1761 domain-containing protein [Bacteroidia bacterium]|nr:DUF1761 domain-containing protein [Bacteroidia bacterium]